MKLTGMGYYNLIRHTSEPKDMYDLFTPADPGEKFGRLEDIETAIRFINEGLDTDVFSSFGNNQQFSYDMIMDHMLKGYILEKMRFLILREDWEPMFSPFPNPDTILDWMEPDVTVSGRSGRDSPYIFVYSRTNPEGEECGDGPFQVSVSDHSHTDSIDYDYSIDAFGHKVTGDDLFDVLDKWHTDMANQDADEEFLEEMDRKLSRAVTDYKNYTSMQK